MERRGREVYKEKSMNDNERIYLSQLIIDPSLIEIYADKVPLESISTKKYRDMYERMRELRRKKVVIDKDVIWKECSDIISKQDFDDVVWAAGSAANIDYFVEQILDSYARMKCHVTALRIIDMVKEPSKLGREIAHEAEKEIISISSALNRDGYKIAGDYIGGVLDLIEHGIRTEGKTIGVDPHWENLANLTGFRNGEYIIIAARPSIGKTAFMVNLLEHFSIIDKIPSAIFSLEMSARMLEYRMVASLTGFSLWGLQNGTYRSKDDIDRIFVAGEKIKNAPLWIDESSTLKISEFESKSRELVRTKGVKIIAVDYISLLDDEQPKIPRFEQIADISRRIKSLAKELDIPIIVLSQLVREVEGKKPSLNSLRETGSLEQDADVVIFLHRERDDKSTSIPTEVIVAKNRNGPIGEVELLYQPRLTKFIEKDGVERAEPYKE